MHGRAERFVDCAPALTVARAALLVSRATASGQAGGPQPHPLQAGGAAHGGVGRERGSRARHGGGGGAGGAAAGEHPGCGVVSHGRQRG